MMLLLVILVPFSLIYEVSQVFAADCEGLWHMSPYCLSDIAV